jgi:hypothetical protein
LCFSPHTTAPGRGAVPRPGDRTKTALAIPNHHASQEANAWLLTHRDELESRARANFSRLDRERRDEAVAEVMAVTLAAALSAARRGRLYNLTPFWCVIFASRQWRQGRRFAGYSSNCVMSEASRIKHGIKVGSLEALDEGAGHEAYISLDESLADRNAEDPFDVVRRSEDFPAIMDMEGVSPKARRTLMFLAENQGGSRQLDLAAELMVSPGRITQLKGELAAALAKHDYVGPLGPRPV